MTRRSDRSIPFCGSILILLVLLGVPGTAWVQEPAATAPAPAAAPDKAPATPPGSLDLPTRSDSKTGSATAAGEPAAAAPAEASGQYLIKEGDTLWDIAAAHYRDPFLWPLIWQANPGIVNPDLIYPGRQLVIPSLAPVERAMSAPQEQAPAVAERPAPVEQAPAPTISTTTAPPRLIRKRSLEAASTEQAAPAPEGSKLILPKETVLPIADKYQMLSAGFVSEEDSDDYLIGSATDPAKSIMGNDDVVYIAVRSRPGVKVGDRFLLFHSENTVRHPVTRKYFGELYRIAGILEVTKVNEEGSTTATAKIILSFGAAEKGCLLMPYQEPTLIYPVAQRPTKNLTGHLLEVTDRRSINGQVDVVYLDKGKENGVDPGDRYLVYADGGNKSGVSKVIGEVEVILVKTRTATAVVKKSTDALSRGDRYQYKN